MEPFKLPESLVDQDIAAMLDSAIAEYRVLADIETAELSDEQMDRLDYLADSVDSLRTAQSESDAAETARIARAESARARLEAASVEDEEVEVATETPEDEIETEVVPDDASSITEQEVETVTASASAPRKTVARRVAVKAPKADAPEVDRTRATLIAAADVPGFSTGQSIADLGELGKAFMARVAGMPRTKVDGAASHAYGVGILKKQVAPQFNLIRGQQEENYDKIVAASKGYTRDATGSLVAGAGWCAPSETIYNLPTIETVSGILSIPEVTMDRGGIRFTKGPDFSTIYTNSGFLQTEAQAIANVAKTFIDVECPAFEDVRMDAIGYGVRAGILTNATWPELVRRYIEGTLVAHAHKVNAAKINRIVALAGTAINATELGSAVVDTLSQLEMQAMRLRYKFRLGNETTIEGFAPYWLTAVLRQDLAALNGVDLHAVTDAQLNQWLAVRNISLQWVYDYQDLAATGVTWPATVDVVLYPAGTYVAGTTDVISLDAVYDTASLTVNTFTAAFFEEGIAIFNPVANGVRVQIALDASGRSGRQDFAAAKI